MVLAAHPAVHAFEYWALNYRRGWRGTVITGMLTPIIFLGAMGLGLGSLVDSRILDASRIGGVTYLVFVAPGLLAWAAMQTGVGESTGPVVSAVLWRRTYEAMLAAPLKTTDVFFGHLLWITLRVGMVSTAFLVAAIALGATQSWLALLAVPAATLTGLACAAPTMAFSVRQVSSVWFDVLFRLVVMPLFLFSGTFFPISQMPAFLRPIAYVTPLWHGVELCRGLTTGALRAGPALAHVGYLVALAVVGTMLAVRNFERTLSK